MHAIVLTLDRQRDAALRAISQHLIDNYGLFQIPDPPHCSLHVAVDYHLEQAEQITCHWAQAVRPIPITASGFGVFPSEHGIVTYTTVAQTPRLTDLQVDLHRRLAPATREFHSLYHPERWVPHITFGTLPKETFGEAFNWLVQNHNPYWTSISTEVSLMEGHDDKFTCRFSAELNGSE